MPGPIIRVWGARTKKEIREARIFRHQLFCEGLCGEVLHDCHLRADQPHEDDENSELFVVTVDGKKVAFARLIVTNIPSRRIWNRLPGRAPYVDSGRKYFEVSRIGMLKEYQGTRIGHQVVLELIGAMISRAVECGCYDFQLTIRAIMFWALPWLPWNLGAPFLFPAREGGPNTPELKPMWSATLNLHEIVVAAQRLKLDRIMFPEGTPWLDKNRARTKRALASLVKRNRRAVTRWREDSDVLRLLQPEADAG